jgi:acetyl esterase/lipase
MKKNTVRKPEVGLILMVGLVLAGCTGPAAEPSAVAPTLIPTQAADPTAAPSATRAPTATLPAPTEPPAATVTSTPGVTPSVTAGTFDAALYGKTLSDVPYCNAPDDGSSQVMDVYYPTQGEPPFPVVIFVHGGSWSGGDKAEGAWIQDRTELVSGGNMFISINYRLARKYIFPAMIEDVKCAIRSVRSNRNALWSDPDRIAVMGTSAGGHLVSLAGVAGPEAGWDVGDYPGVSSQVNAVVDLYGAIVLDDSIEGMEYIVRQSFGASDLTDPILEKYTPLAYITPDDPPFLVVHGMQDDNVPIAQSERLVAALKAAGVPVTYVPINGVGHTMPYNANSSPSYAELLVTLRAFLDQAIGRGATP